MKLIKIILLILSLILIVTLFFGCIYLDVNENNTVTYEMQDFSDITVGKSTANDVYEIAPIDTMIVTSFGGVIEYPMKDGSYIQIKCLGPELTVTSIEKVDSSWND